MFVGVLELTLFVGFQLSPPIINSFSPSAFHYLETVGSTRNQTQSNMSWKISSCRTDMNQILRIAIFAAVTIGQAARAETAKSPVRVEKPAAPLVHDSRPKITVEKPAHKKPPVPEPTKAHKPGRAEPSRNRLATDSYDPHF
jgi:hypothetical protein